MGATSVMLALVRFASASSNDTLYCAGPPPLVPSSSCTHPERSVLKSPIGPSRQKTDQKARSPVVSPPSTRVRSTSKPATLKLRLAYTSNIIPAACPISRSGTNTRVAFSSASRVRFPGKRLPISPCPLIVTGVPNAERLLGVSASHSGRRYTEKGSAVAARKPGSAKRGGRDESTDSGQLIL